MEFSKKLQQLRKQSGFTQEELAETLHISRTAVSKWESGRGYPNIEALKALAKIFSVSIDELLTEEKRSDTMEAARQTHRRLKPDLWYGIFDLAALSLVFLPLYGQREGTFIRAVPLLACTDLPLEFRILFFVQLAAIFITGAGTLLLDFFRSGKKKRMHIWSFAQHAFAILLFASARQPYVTVFLFTLFLAKGIVLTRNNIALKTR